MRLLLDTHVWLWMVRTSPRMSEPGRSVLQDANNDVLLSAASSWEIAIKHALGKLPLPAPPAEWVPEAMRISGVAELTITHLHTLHVAALPLHHADPFDRLLIAQAQVEDLTIMTADPRFEPYDVETVSP